MVHRHVRWVWTWMWEKWTWRCELLLLLLIVAIEQALKALFYSVAHVSNSMRRGLLTVQTVIGQQNLRVCVVAFFR